MTEGEHEFRLRGLRAHPGTLLGHEPAEAVVPSREHRGAVDESPLLNPRYTF